MFRFLATMASPWWSCYTAMPQTRGGLFVGLLLIGGAVWAQEPDAATEPYVLVLGIAQDGGYPQAGCDQPCCRPAWENPERVRYVVSLAIVDPRSGQRWLIDCTPDFKHQLRLLDQTAPVANKLGIDGIFLTHAHVGHYAGLLHLGREALGAQGVKTHAMPRMKHFLQSNGPWSLLVDLRNIEMVDLAADEPVALNERITVTPLPVPHRDEFSETVAFRISGPNRAVLFLPDIDKWERWERTIEQEIGQVDTAYLDATFYEANELPGRDLREIPHPLVTETLQRLGHLPVAERNKVRLIHLNHSNPLLQPDSAARQQIQKSGFQIAEQSERVGL